jgi:hypothetical protein
MAAPSGLSAGVSTDVLFEGLAADFIQASSLVYGNLSDGGTHGRDSHSETRFALLTDANRSSGQAVPKARHSAATATAIAARVEASYG